MGQKVNPHGLRVGVINDWNTKWYADSKEFGDLLVEDNKIRNYLKEKLYQAGISKIEIERAAGRIKVIILTAKPGIIIGKEAAGVKALKEELQAMTSAKVSLNIVEVKRPERDMDIDTSKLYVQEAYANQGPTLKRIRPRSQGRADRILKRTSHITIILNER